jgi:amidase
MAEKWLAQSIVARRGVGWGRKSKLLELTEAAQGKFHYTIGPYSNPVLSVSPGDRIRVETRDAFEGAIRTEHDKPSERLRMPFVNPQNGPIMVEGAPRHMLHDPVFRRTHRHVAHCLAATTAA